MAHHRAASPPLLSAGVNAVVKVASSDAYRAAQQKRQAGQQLTEEEESALASMERHARHLEAKSSRAGGPPC